MTDPRLAVLAFNKVPRVCTTHKYERFGRMAIQNRILYCGRHDYPFNTDSPIATDRPACWAKLPAILDAFDRHEWVA